jgi:hypothetical protein
LHIPLPCLFMVGECDMSPKFNMWKVSLKQEAFPFVAVGVNILMRDLISPWHIRTF